MAEPVEFDELIRRIRAGDHAAAATLVKSYEPAIRRAIRFRLTDSRLGGVLDSMDICQSVMGSFFFRAASGQYELQSPQQLLKLLTAMAHNKLISQSRKQHARRRDDRRVRSVGDDEGQLVSRGKSPSAEVAARDLLEEVHRRLSPEERHLLELRNQGLDWAAVAEQLGGGAEALRKKLARALDRVSAELGLDDDS